MLVALCACIPLDSKRVPKKNPDFLNVGHRGAPEQAAENTIASLDAALALGARAVEVDLCVTSDRQVVLWHDRDPDDEVALARQNGLEGLPWRPWVPDSGSPFRRPIDELTLIDFRTTHGYAREGVRDPAAVVPLFDDFLDWAAAQRELRAVYLDLKVDDPADVAPILDAVADAGLEATVYVMSVDRPIVEAVIAAGVNGVKPIWDHEDAGALEHSLELGLRDLALGLTPLRSESGVLEEVDEAVRARREGRIDTITVWTLNEPMELTLFMFHEVDAIFTDDPELLDRIWQATL